MFYFVYMRKKRNFAYGRNIKMMISMVYHMKNILLSATMLLCAATMTAQPSHDDFIRNAAVCGDNYYAYPEPVGVTMTPAPEGYTPCYLTHYGRHGSRWLIGRSAYDTFYDKLREAEDSAQLTPLGRKLMAQLDTLRQYARGREGELTHLGAVQHRGIAHRMYENFPMLFQAGGKVEARSSTVIRCILSMTSELAELQGLSPSLQMDIDAAVLDMSYINSKEKWNKGKKDDKRGDGNGVDTFRQRHFSPVRLLNTLFASEDYWRRHIEHPTRFVIDNLWKLSASMQGIDVDKQTDLSQYFTSDEQYGIWLARNAEWYVSHGPSTKGISTQMQRQRHLLRNLVEKADSCLALINQKASHPETSLQPVTASLRFGHDVVVMPMVCALNLDGYGTCYDDLEQLEQKGWYSYRIFPMGSNIQMVFYRPTSQKGDVLVKALLNEHEATMPQLTPAYGKVYYKWSDVRDYIVGKIKEYDAAYEEAKE